MYDSSSCMGELIGEEHGDGGLKDGGLDNGGIAGGLDNGGTVGGLETGAGIAGGLTVDIDRGGNGGGGVIDSIDG